MVSRAMGGQMLRRAVFATALAMIVILLLVRMDSVQALTDGPASSVEAQGESPYEFDVTTVETPFWLEPWGPLARLPVWAAAAVLAGVATAAILIVIGIGRLVWKVAFNRNPWR